MYFYIQVKGLSICQCLVCLFFLRQTKIILFWNLYFGVGRFFSSKIDRAKLISSKCLVSDCEFIDDVDRFNESDVVIFFAHYLYEIPSYRFPHQHFVFFQMESPAIEMSDSLLFNRTRYNFFNRTMTYRLDSDIVLRELHGQVVPKHVIPLAIQTDDSPAPSNSHHQNLWKSKTKMVAWFVSNCNTTIGRENYVKELSKYVPIDIYGQCGNLSCPADDWRKCFEMVRKDYKFYLALENSLCKDYVTEKFFRPLYYDTVPIVMARAHYSTSADYSAFGPSHSYIDVMNFDSPQEVAEYLLLLDQNDELYSRYFDWKKDYEVELNPMDGWCNLCQMAHDPQPPVKTYSDVMKWWVKDACRDPNGLDEDYWMEWVVVDSNENADSNKE